MSENYLQGFARKCAEYGVDPEELVKQAARGEYAAGQKSAPGLVSRLEAHKGNVEKSIEDMMESAGEFKREKKRIGKMPRGGKEQAVEAEAVRFGRKLGYKPNALKKAIEDAVRVLMKGLK